MSDSGSDFGPQTFNASNVDLTTADPRDVICAMAENGNDYNGHMGARISALFVILIVSSAATFFPVIAKRFPRLHIPLYVYLFARYFGSGVIVATAFIHLLDPAYDEIGPASCVGMTGAWADYAWCPAIVLASVMVIFLMDFGAERFVEVKYGIASEADIQGAVTGQPDIDLANPTPAQQARAANLAETRLEHNGNQPHEHRNGSLSIPTVAQAAAYEKKFKEDWSEDELDSEARKSSFRQQIAAFLILEFGVIFHSVVIGLNLGVVGDEFSTLYPVLVFHQSFEGLGIGARMSSIPFAPGSWLPWLLCAAYGLTTPIAIAIGLGVRTTYNPNSYTANVVSGVLDALSAGILIYTGLVELLARDFLFNPLRTKDNKRLLFMVVNVLLGAGLMALLGKWA
ncbi:Zinc-regulated transporter 1 [Exophiala dermatitidis]